MSSAQYPVKRRVERDHSVNIGPTTKEHSTVRNFRENSGAKCHIEANWLIAHDHEVLAAHIEISSTMTVAN